MNKKESLDELKLFVSKLMNEEQDIHAKKIEGLTKIGTELQSMAETIKTLHLLHNAKIEALEKVYKEIQRLQ